MMASGLVGIRWSDGSVEASGVHVSQRQYYGQCCHVKDGRRTLHIARTL